MEVIVNYVALDKIFNFEINIISPRGKQTTEDGGLGRSRYVYSIGHKVGGRGMFTAWASLTKIQEDRTGKNKRYHLAPLSIRYIEPTCATALRHGKRQVLSRYLCTPILHYMHVLKRLFGGREGCVTWQVAYGGHSQAARCFPSCSTTAPATYRYLQYMITRTAEGTACTATTQDRTSFNLPELLSTFFSPLSLLQFLRFLVSLSCITIAYHLR